MAPEARPAPEHLSSRIGEDYLRFDFFQLMRLIECAHPDRPRIGGTSRPVQDAALGELPEPRDPGGTVLELPPVAAREAPLAYEHRLAQVGCLTRRAQEWAWRMHRRTGALDDSSLLRLA